ncbi:MAG: hypothetical protein M1379_08795 [Firmicutes bacterium]|nr:hypothetical protein [Bacillota bacterium]
MLQLYVQHRVLYDLLQEEDPFTAKNKAKLIFLMPEELRLFGRVHVHLRQ